MNIPPDFVVGGRYRIEAPISSGGRFKVYLAHSEAHGPGPVAVKVAQYHGQLDASAIRQARARVEAEWTSMLVLHQRTSTAVPLPLELVHMYPADPVVRSALLGDRELLRHEPYMVCELVSGHSLAQVLERGEIDEERALLIALRIACFARSALEIGLVYTDFSPSNFMLEQTGENLTVVDTSGCRPHPRLGALLDREPDSRSDAAGAEPIEPGFGRLLLALLTGSPAPDWPANDSHRQRWDRLLVERRVPAEFRPLILGSLGWRGLFDATLDSVENRLRALTASARPVVHPRGGDGGGAPYLVRPGERIADRFSVLGPLGQGGRGFVYRATDDRSGAEVLLKCNKYVYDAGSRFALELPTRRAELEHEYEVLRRFATKTGMMPQPVDFVRDRGRGAWFDLAPELAGDEPWLAMERIRGVPLSRLLPRPHAGYDGALDRDNRLRPRFVLRVIAELAELLSIFHEEGFLYQDLKPDNVLFDTVSENLFLVDFAATCPRGPDGHLLRDSVAFGSQTHGFAAPEFADLWEKVDARFDIYSLGATAYHLLTGVCPERVALEEGSEYPKLRTDLLATLPDAVAQLIGRCLAPHAYRYITAREVAHAAEQARLLLSRSRPLDVRELRVDYRAHALALSWQLPPDPRVERVSVMRFDDGHEVSVYDGAATDSVEDDHDTSGDRHYVVRTALLRHGSPIRSRGREVRAEAHPGPVQFDVTPWFGGNRVRVRVAAHATGAIVRWSSAAPPMGPDEGEALPLLEDRSAFHPTNAGTEVHYAAFARYGGDAVSIGRFRSATAEPPLPSDSVLRAEQSAGGVVLRWDAALPNATVIARDAAGGERTLRATTGENEIMDGAPRADERVVYSLFARSGSVVSEPLATAEVTRWPDPPRVEALAGADRIVVCARGSDRFATFDVRVIPEGDDAAAVAGSFPGPVLHESIPVPGGGRFTMFVMGRTEGSADGPAASLRGEVPSASRLPALRCVRETLPIEWSLRMAGRVGDWPGGVRVELQRDGEVILGAPALSWETGTEGESELALRDSSTAPGTRAAWSASLVTASGDALVTAPVSLRALEQLEPPPLAAQLEAVLVGRAATPPRGPESDASDRLSLRGPAGDAHVVSVELASEVKCVDLLVVGEGGEKTRLRCTPPVRIECAPGERVRIAWRRSVEGDPMPWSEPSEATALMRPPAPQEASAIACSDGVRVSWAPGLPGTAWRVRALHPSPRALYHGEATEILDAESPAGGGEWEIVAIRDGLESTPTRIVTESAAVFGTPNAAPVGSTGAPSPPGLAALPMRDAALSLPVAAAVARRTTHALREDVRILRTSGSAGALEIDRAVVGRLYALLAAADDTALLAAAAGLGAAGDPWHRVHALVGASFGWRSRLTLPWNSSRARFGVWATDSPMGNGPWHRLAGPVEAPRGVIWTAALDEQNVLTCTPVRGAVATPQTPGAGAATSSSPASSSEPAQLTHAQERLILSREGGARESLTPNPLMATAPALAFLLPADTASPAGVRLDVDSVPSILVPALDPTSSSDPDPALWRCVALGWCTWVVRLAAATWRAPILGFSTGTTTAATLLIDGSPVSLSLRLDPSTRTDLQAIEVTVSTVIDSFTRSFRLRLSSVRRAWGDDAESVLQWAAKLSRRSHRELDAALTRLANTRVSTSGATP